MPLLPHLVTLGTAGEWSRQTGHGTAVHRMGVSTQEAIPLVQ